jgi:molybdopterin converting factor small subunit
MSPNVTIRFTGELRALAGQGTLQLSMETEASLRDALSAAGERVSPSFTNQVIEPLLAGDPAVPILLLNRTLVSVPELDRLLGEGDTIAFVLPMGGG